MAQQTQSQAVLHEKRKKEMEARSRILTPKEAEQMGVLFERARKAKNQREGSHEEFDGLTYSQDDLLNKRAAMTYLRPKRNDSEVRVATGLTEKKIEVVHNELLALNMQHEIIAYDRDDMEIAELGEDMSDLVTRTNQIERDDDFWQEAVQEMLTKRAVFIEENFVDVEMPNGHVFSMAEKSVVNGMKILLGDMSIPSYRFLKQPYIWKYDRMHIDLARKLHGDNPNWKHVRAGKGQAQSDEYFGAFNFRLFDLEDDEVEILTYESLIDKEMQQYVGSVPMHKVGANLDSKYNGYSVRMFTMKPMHADFAYGKPLTASAKTMQALSDETIRNLIRKFRQALEPPMATKGKKIFSRDIWEAGSVAHGIGKNEFEKLIDHAGVTTSEFQMYELIEQKAEEFLGVSNQQQGIESRGEETATEIIEKQRQAAKNLGLSVAALIRMKRDMTFVRLGTIFENHLKPVRKRVNPQTQQVEDVFRRFTIKDTSIDKNGRQGRKIINLADRDLEQEELQAIDDLEQEELQRGRPVKFKSMNVKTLQNIPIIWYVTVNPKQRDGSALEKVMFQDKLNQVAVVSKMAGKAPAGDVIAEDFERIWEAKGWIQDDAQNALNQMPNPFEQLQQGGGEGDVAGQLKQGANAPTQKPSVNELSNR